MSNGEEEEQVYLSVVEVADMLRRTPKAMEKMRLEGRGPPYWRLGAAGVGKVVYSRADVLVWLLARAGN
ncbi:helix-turn-helix domain-containing protein [Hyphomicrobium zavarzinii]|jgi:hypothetical protein|uniref:helix-turn-helix domain-containing protein n=1 Tax=Hyphomicrobium zavarzinii TaxID=48292 RepID=UPI00037DC5C5